MIFGVVFCSQGRAADFYHTGNSVFYGVSDRSGDYLICDAGAQRTFSGLVLPVDSACGNLFPDGVMCAGLLCRTACEICISDDICEAAGEWINLVP
mgnify:FL=1